MARPELVHRYCDSVEADRSAHPIRRAPILISTGDFSTAGDLYRYTVCAFDSGGAPLEMSSPASDAAWLIFDNVYVRASGGRSPQNARRLEARRAGFVAAGGVRNPSKATELWTNTVRIFGMPGSVAEPKAPATSPSAKRAGPVPRAAASPPPVPEPVVINAVKAPVLDSFRGESGEQAFYRMLPRVAEAFERSDVAAKQRSLGEHWYYDLCNLPLVPGRPLLLGLNPGRDPKARHVPQTSYPGSVSYLDVSSWRFISRSASFFSRYFVPIEQCNYLNVCPFRSPGTSDLTAKDWQLGLDSFFLDAVEYLQPSKVLLIGTSGVNQLRMLGIVSGRDIEIAGDRNSVRGLAGTLNVRKGASRLPPSRTRSVQENVKQFGRPCSPHSRTRPTVTQL